MIPTGPFSKLIIIEKWIPKDGHTFVRQRFSLLLTYLMGYEQSGLVIKFEFIFRIKFFLVLFFIFWLYVNTSDLFYNTYLPSNKIFRFFLKVIFHNV